VALLLLTLTYPFAICLYAIRPSIIKAVAELGREEEALEYKIYML